MLLDPEYFLPIERPRMVFSMRFPIKRAGYRRLGASKAPSTRVEGLTGP